MMSLPPRRNPRRNPHRNPFIAIHCHETNLSCSNIRQGKSPYLGDKHSPQPQPLFTTFLPSPSLRIQSSLRFDSTMNLSGRPSSSEPPRKKRGRYAYYKCEQCRKDKQKCLPAERQPGERCTRCQSKGFDCSENTTASASASTPVARNRTSTSSTAPPLSPSRASDDIQGRVKNFLCALAWGRALDDASPPGDREDTKLDDTMEKLAEKLNCELIFLYRTALDAQDLILQTLLFTLIISGPYFLEGPRYDRLSFDSNILIPVDEIGDAMGPGEFDWELSEPHASAMGKLSWTAGHTDRGIRILEEQVRRAVRKDFYLDNPACTSSIRAYLRACMEVGRVNSRLLHEGYLDLAEDIPYLHRSTHPWRHLDDLFDGPTDYHNIEWICLNEPQYVKTIDVEGKTILHMICRHVLFHEHTINAAQLLLDHHVPINCQDHNGHTALHIFCLCRAWFERCSDLSRQNSLSLLRLLITNPEIDTDLEDEYGNVASFYLREYLESVETQADRDYFEELLSYFVSNE
ncbi:hypothetical protein B0I35DRAFT_437503 [Stachybotrys elegans]|uniref:Zn(2)-C6 fungal-type domain-containing protein n=1 Tax=Stachybotrys elegans TaxID=80388 RepID=A0A8K0SI23_9HYPO|nr:hypothetical protein B0I35DRAFT_437503 [Stachybotrys elegans]